LKLVDYGRAHPKKRKKFSTLDCKVQKQSRVVHQGQMKL
jgi:hypothetical protein